jgi:hypothetical protein
MTHQSGNMEKKKPHIGFQKVLLDDEEFFMISNHDRMDPFFMSIVSDGNHWMFISSNGGLTAGRKNAEYALFPYYTDDKLTDLQDKTGSKSIFHIEQEGAHHYWEPFSNRNSRDHIYQRNLYKSIYGNKIVFEEIHAGLKLIFRYSWSSSNQYGFVRESTIINNSGLPTNISMIDGIQNVLPCGVDSSLQNASSNLVNAYKRTELDEKSGLGIFALSAIIVDRAEPSEALKANTVWSTGLSNPTYLLSSRQLDRFRQGEEVIQELDMKSGEGAYLVVDRMILHPEDEQRWSIVANVNQGPSDVAKLIQEITSGQKQLQEKVKSDVQLGTKNLKQLVAASDGFQLSNDDKRNARHYSNTLFNIMRGGIIDDNYLIEKGDFEEYLKNANKEVHLKATSFLESFDKTISYQELNKKLAEVQNPALIRLAKEYLPLKFSRRHGDPSRPWNRFSINTRSEKDGSKILDYEGNWRDIFQNWEALAHSYPEFIDSMITKFLNASTFDGYNPYRVTKGGFDWEVIEEHDPWSYIGYWGDHQIIYLLKFLEFAQHHYPGKLNAWSDQAFFVYANVPYKIKPYDEILTNPKDTIIFDHREDQEIRKLRSEIGADGALLKDKNGEVVQVSFIEKILVTVLAKVSNFIPEGGIWMNTQRPEWNDANNALVGNGVSMVTLYYLRRFFDFFQKYLNDEKRNSFVVSNELFAYFKGVSGTLVTHVSMLSGSMTHVDRKTIMDGLGNQGSIYREKIYNKSFSGQKTPIQKNQLLAFTDVCLKFLDHSIDQNKRNDNMYHAYNIMTLDKDHGVDIGHLDEMLEGQVAVLSSGALDASQSLAVLDALKASDLFRDDQFSYLLYPNKLLPGFLNKNIVPEARVFDSPLLVRLMNDQNTEIIECDINGAFHFNGNFNNAASLEKALKALPDRYHELLHQDESLILEIFEEVFNHKAFTGRSGTFYGYEGLGSIYWHMVSKLALAVEETCLQAIYNQEPPEITGRLLEHYYEINEGIGVHKSPELYGAFPIDPYSHTPASKGAQQPGMTGQVKEDILCRIGELGVMVHQGELHFKPVLLRKEEMLQEEKVFGYVDINQEEKSINLDKGSLAFTYCQVPIIYYTSSNPTILLYFTDGTHSQIHKQSLDVATTRKLFERNGEIVRIEVGIPEDQLK